MNEPVSFAAYKTIRESANANTSPKFTTVDELIAIVTKRQEETNLHSFEPSVDTEFPDTGVIDFESFKTNKSDIEEEDFDDFASGIALDTAAVLVDMLEEFNYSPYDNPESVKCLMMMVESIKAFMYKIKGKDYMLHPVIDHYIRINEGVSATEILDFMLDESDDE